MSPDPYANKLFSTSGTPCVEKPPVVGVINCTLHARSDRRGLELAPFPSRALCKYEIHELILTNEDAAPGKTVNQIAYLGFFEIEQGGILWAGDQVTLNGKPLGSLAGYDLTHYPNHFNIIIKAALPLKTGLEAGVHPGDKVAFIFHPTETQS